jgi:DNA-binding NtrC family response regulator
MKILLTFTGFHDPYTVGLIGDEELPGPILSMAKHIRFEKIILLSTPRTGKNTNNTKQALESSQPNASVEVYDLPLGDPTDYLQILKELRGKFHIIADNNPDAEFSISVASGTPQMHACWLLLVSSGEIPARILHIRPPHFVTKDRPLVIEIDLKSPDFPIVKPNLFMSDNGDDSLNPDINNVLRDIGIVGDHPTMKKAVEIAAMLAPSDVPMLILGETGTGKELFAKLIHILSNRSKNPFVPINCAAIPKELVESILFGHKRGAFTGAVTDLIGKFDAANTGTLFLDELAELPVSTQSKLLRILQDGMVEPLGSAKPHKVDVRIIAATNQNIHEAIKSGKFRQDLYYRLNVGEIRLPPLRERKSDIPKIALYVLDRINESLKNPKRLSAEALRKLQSHSWYGNARDLENVIERSARLSRKEVLEAEDLMITEPVNDPDLPLLSMPEPQSGFSLEAYLYDNRTCLIKRALELTSGNQSEAARLLGISPQAVHKFLKKEKM